MGKMAIEQEKSRFMENAVFDVFHPTSVRRRKVRRYCAVGSRPS